MTFVPASYPLARPLPGVLVVVVVVVVVGPLVSHTHALSLEGPAVNNQCSSDLSASCTLQGVVLDHPGPSQVVLRVQSEHGVFEFKGQEPETGETDPLPNLTYLDPEGGLSGGPVKQMTVQGSGNDLKRALEKGLLYVPATYAWSGDVVTFTAWLEESESTTVSLKVHVVLPSPRKRPRRKRSPWTSGLFSFLLIACTVGGIVWYLLYRANQNRRSPWWKGRDRL